MYLSRIARQVFVGFLFQIQHPFHIVSEWAGNIQFLIWRKIYDLTRRCITLSFYESISYLYCLIHLLPIIRKILTACVAVWNILTQDQVLWRQIEANRVFRQRLIHVLNLSKKSNFLCGNHIKMPQVHRSQNTMLWPNWSITSMPGKTY